MKLEFDRFDGLDTPTQVTRMLILNCVSAENDAQDNSDSHPICNRFPL